ncbi:MAG: Asp-tRNA(Asn)/Glu-tRNA(Gln) amidotransferase subunit GatA [Planctomycetaceae bacterium]
MDWIGRSVFEMASALQLGEVTAQALAEEHLSHIEACEPKVRSFVEVFREQALTAAEEVDRKRAAGEKLGPLAGVPVAIKDNICVKGEIASCSSKMLENFRSPYNSHVTERLLDAGAVLVGRTNMDEFAMGSSCESSAFFPTSNPWALDRTPGGSSGGSAAAVAAGFAPIAIGSDTGGSIRQPASFCGVVGLKPTYGRVSRFGLIAFASSLDQIGPITTDVRGAALTLDAIAGHDGRDSTSANEPVPSFSDSLEQPLAGLRVGVVAEHDNDGLDDEVRQAVANSVDAYRKLGAEIVNIDLPNAQYGVAVYYVLAPSEASSNLARYDGVHYGYRAEAENGAHSMIEMYEHSRGQGFGDEVKRRIMLGTYALSSGYYDAYYKKALQVRRLIRDDFTKAFESVDFVLSPTSPTPPFKIGEMIDNPLALYLNDLFTIGANLAGLPAISLPCGKTAGGLPIGVQLIAPAFEEARLLRASRMLEQEIGWNGELAGCVSQLAGG